MIENISSHKGRSLRIGVVGTAKNTGKTTTLVALLSEAGKNGLHPAITGIGYDGEAIDNLTFLPKPRVDVSPGFIIGTAKECVFRATAKSELLEDSEEDASLGIVELVRISSSGRILLVGPNNAHALDRVLLLMDKYSPLILIDGALGRMVPMSAADAVIFATGAARTNDIRLLADEMKAIQDVFSLDSFPRISQLPEMPERVTVYDGNNRALYCHFSSLLGSEDVFSLRELLKPGISRIAIPGAVSASCLNSLLESHGAFLNGVVFYFSSPAVLLAGGNPLEVKEILDKIQDCGAIAAYHKPLPILAVTINPFYPKPAKRRGFFDPAYVEEEKLLHEFTRCLSVPVFNIIKQGAAELFDLVRLYLQNEVIKK
ncbi:hypothetical protein JW926_01860 [Candidatus Sumerlaeota bacterium]|nr:hypothetical protein [Candidatus Sumerlaeota bacterium]